MSWLKPIVTLLRADAAPELNLHPQYQVFFSFGGYRGEKFDKIASLQDHVKSFA